MNKLKQLEKKKEEIEKQIEELKSKDDIIYEDKNVKVIKWEDKPFEDFKMPKGYEWIPFSELIDLINSKKLDFDKSHYFYTKSPFIRPYWGLQGVCLYDDLNVSSSSADWSNAGDGSRVVISKIKEKLK